MCEQHGRWILGTSQQPWHPVVPSMGDSGAAMPSPSPPTRRKVERRSPRERRANGLSREGHGGSSPRAVHALSPGSSGGAFRTPTAARGPGRTRTASSATDNSGRQPYGTGKSGTTLEAPFKGPRQPHVARKPLVRATQPSPADYSPSVHFTTREKRQAVFTFGSSPRDGPRLETHHHTPGPGAHDGAAVSSVGAQRLSSRSSAASFGFGTGDRFAPVPGSISAALGSTRVRVDTHRERGDDRLDALGGSSFREGLTRRTGGETGYRVSQLRRQSTVPA